MLPSFNDDIQGTAATALAGLLAGGRATGTPLAEQRIVMVGAGAAGMGIARLLRAALLRAGLRGRRRSCAPSPSWTWTGSSWTPTSSTAAGSPGRRRWPRAPGLTAGHARPARPSCARCGRPPSSALRARPGSSRRRWCGRWRATSSARSSFRCRTPPSKAEAAPSDLLAWTDGRALVATGSPFGSVEYGGRTVRIGQGNNVFVFPGVGLGLLVSEAREITDAMFAAAAETLAAEVAEADLQAGALYPPISASAG